MQPRRPNDQEGGRQKKIYICWECEQPFFWVDNFFWRTTSCARRTPVRQSNQIAASFALSHYMIISSSLEEMIEEIILDQIRLGGSPTSCATLQSRQLCPDLEMKMPTSDFSQTTVIHCKCVGCQQYNLPTGHLIYLDSHMLLHALSLKWNSNVVT